MNWSDMTIYQKVDHLAELLGVIEPSTDSIDLFGTPLVIDAGDKPVKSTPDGFEEFWQAYPNKVAKGGAERAFRAARIKNVKVLLDAIDKRNRLNIEMTSRNEFVPNWPNPTTWLNQRRWEDVIKNVVEKSESPLDIKRTKCCICDEEGVKSIGAKWYCRNHDQWSHL